jgi:glycerate kinase
MKKVLLVPDSFKGTMSSSEICKIMEERVRAYFPEAEVLKLPVADGGEGSVDAFLTACGGEKIKLTAKGPYRKRSKNDLRLTVDNLMRFMASGCVNR